MLQAGCWHRVSWSDTAVIFVVFELNHSTDKVIVVVSVGEVTHLSWSVPDLAQ